MPSNSSGYAKCRRKRVYVTIIIPAEIKKKKKKKKESSTCNLVLPYQVV